MKNESGRIRDTYEIKFRQHTQVNFVENGQSYLSSYHAPFHFSDILPLQSHQALLKEQIYLSVLLFIYAQLEKEFYHSWRILQKYLIVCGKCACLERTQRIRHFQNGFLYTKLSSNMPKVFKRAWRTRLRKAIQTCQEITPRVFCLLWRIRQST